MRFPVKRGAVIDAGLSIRSNFVIPEKAGIQRLKNSSRKRDNITVLSASQFLSYWIPAFAGMTG